MVGRPLPCSTARQGTPRLPRSAASASPTGPAPTIRIGVSIWCDGISAASVTDYLARIQRLRLGDQLRRHVDGVVDDRGGALAAERVHFEIELPGLLQEASSFMVASNAAPQRGGAVGRHVGRGEERPPERRRQRQQRQDLPLLGGLRQLVHQRHLRESLVPLVADLVEHHHPVAFDPGRPLLQDAGEARAGAGGDLAALHGEIELGGALVAHHDLELGAEHDVHRIRIDEGAGAGAGGADDELALPSRRPCVLKPDVCHATVIRLLVPVEPSQ